MMAMLVLEDGRIFRGPGAEEALGPGAARLP